MVLDELDSGIGSRLGAVMGRLLQRMAATSVSQLLCVSHLPQVRLGWTACRPLVSVMTWMLYVHGRQL